MFKTRQESTLDPAQRALFTARLESLSEWIIHRHGGREAICSPRCARTLLADSELEVLVCQPCLALKKSGSLIQALSVSYATDDNIKYIPKVLMMGDTFNATLIRYGELQVVQASLEKQTRDGDCNFWALIGHYGKAGLFDNREPFRALVQAVGIRAERESRGRSLRGMRFDGYLDNFLTTLGAYSTKALELFNDNFAGRTAQSQRQIRQRTGMNLHDGLHMNNFVRLAELLDSLGYHGPVAAATDQTVCVQALRHHGGVLVGAEGGDVPFDREEDLEALVRDIVNQDRLCSKVRTFFFFSFFLPFFWGLFF